MNVAKSVHPAAHRCRVALRLQHEGEMLKCDNKIDLPVGDKNIGENDCLRIVIGQNLNDTLKQCAFKVAMASGCPTAVTWGIAAVRLAAYSCAPPA
jgi:hypothetical protein